MNENVLGKEGSQAMTATTTEVTAGEIQTIVAARRLRHTKTVFIGVGRPSTAALLARMVHNPELILVYESGTIGAKPFHIPLSIGDGELAETADSIVSVPEMFNYWIGAGRIDVAFLGRGADRSPRQPELDRDRRLRPSEDAAAGSGRRARDRRQLRRGDRDRARTPSGRSWRSSTS